MPEISRFGGIVITMYFNEHNPPHFHASYNGIEAQFDLNEGAFTRGALPSKQARLVLAWYELHKIVPDVEQQRIQENQTIELGGTRYVQAKIVSGLSGR